MNTLNLNLDATTIHATERGDLLPIVIDGVTFEPREDGMWDLNEIWHGMDLLASARPSEWRTKTKERYINSGNLRNIGAGRNGGTHATEKATIAYAMWVSDEFYDMVLDAFIQMRQQAIIEAKTQLALNIAKANGQSVTTMTRSLFKIGPSVMNEVSDDMTTFSLPLTTAVQHMNILLTSHGYQTKDMHGHYKPTAKGSTYASWREGMQGIIWNPEVARVLYAELSPAEQSILPPLR